MPVSHRVQAIDTALGIRLTGQDEALYFEFLRQFPGDDTLSRLADALARRDDEQSFRFAHMLKGLCAQLGLKALEQASQTLCDILRKQPADPDAALAAFAAVKAAHRRTIAAIAKL